MSSQRSREETQQHLVSAGEAGERVDRLVGRLSGRGRAGARRLLEAGAVRLNGRMAAKGAVVRAGDRLELDGRAAATALAPNPELPLQVVYEDAAVVVVDKPAGQHCHPLEPEDDSTLVSAVLARYPEMSGLGYSALEPGLLHRIDYDTSGLVLFARDAATFEHFAHALRPNRPRKRAAHEVSRTPESREHGGSLDVEVIRKRYVALCAGTVSAPALHRAQLLARGARVRVSQITEPGTRPVETTVLAAQHIGAAYSLVELSVPSAARHQIRAHLAALQHPIAGDALYGGPNVPYLSRHFLHASDLWLALPGRAEPLELHSPLPPELREALCVVSHAAPS